VNIDKIRKRRRDYYAKHREARVEEQKQRHKRKMQNREPKTLRKLTDEQVREILRMKGTQKPRKNWQYI